MPLDKPLFDCTYAALGVCTGSEWDIFQKIDCPIALCSLDDLTIEKLNPAFASLHGYPIGELTGKSLWDLAAPECRESTPEWLQLASERGHHSWECRHQRADGTTFPILVRVKTVENEIGNAGYYLVTVEDITERRRTEEALQLLFENHPQPMWIGDVETQAFLAVNKAACDRYGYSEAEFLSMTIADIRREEEAGVEKHQKKNGTVLYVEITSRRLTLEGRAAQIAIANEIAAGNSQSEQKLKEEVRERSQRLFERIAEASPNIIYIYDLILQRNIYSNCRVEQILGYSGEELQQMGATLLENLMHPDDFALLGEMLRCALAAVDGEVLENEYRLKKASGEWHWFSSREIIFSRNADGEVQQILGVLQDISDRKQAEEALRRSEERYRLLVKNFPNGAVVLFDRDLRYLLVDGKAIAAVGLSKEQFEGKTLWEAFPPERAALLEPIYRTALAGETKTFEFFYEDRFYLVEALPLENDVGEVVAGMVVSQDITPRVKAEAALRESEEKFRQLAETIDSVFWMTTPARDRLLYVSPAYETIWGRSCVSAYEQPQSWIDAIHPDDRDRVRGEIDEQTRAGYPRDCLIEYRLVKPNGKIRYIRDRSFPIRNESGEVYRLVGICEDITVETLYVMSLRQAEEALQKLNEELETRVQKRTQQLKRTNESLSRAIHQNTQIWQQYCRVIESLKEVVFQTDEIGVFSLLNPAWKKITGFSTYASINKNLLDYVHPEDVLETRGQFQRLIERQQDYCCCQSRFLTKDGTFRWMEVFAQLILDVGGTIIGIAGTLNDVTERKIAEIARENSEARFRSLFEQAAVGVAQLGLNFDWLLVNQKLCDILGYSCEELLARTYLDVIHLEDFATTRDYMRSLLADEIQTYSVEKRFIRQDKSVIWVNVTTSLVRDETPPSAGEAAKNNPQYFIKVVEDITRRKQAEEKLRKSEANLAEAQKIAHLGNWELDLATKDITCSEETFRIFGLDPARGEATLKKFLSAIHPADRKRWLGTVKQAFRSENSQIEFRLIAPDDSIRYIYARREIFTNERGERERLFGTVQDISDRKKAEEEVLKALAKERELSELKSRFVSMTSHEFRTPLAIIQSSTQLLQRYEWSREEQLEQLQQIRSAVKHMTDLLEDVLTIGKAEAGKLDFNPAPLELEEFCRRLVSDMQRSHSSGHRIYFTVESGFPVTTELNHTADERGMTAEMDEKLLRQILTNLLANAIKYSPESGTIQLILSLDAPDGIAAFVIQDQGIGIPADDISHLFESFHRARNVGTIPGTGLGLAIVKKCVDLHGGTIAVSSKVGVGTTFKVSIPLNRHRKNEENFNN